MGMCKRIVEVWTLRDGSKGLFSLCIKNLGIGLTIGIEGKECIFWIVSWCLCMYLHEILNVKAVIIGNFRGLQLKSRILSVLCIPRVRDGLCLVELVRDMVGFNTSRWWFDP